MPEPVSTSTPETRPGTGPETLRRVDLARTGTRRYEATNVRGGTIAVGSGGDDDFTPVELLLVALAACGAVDLDHIAGKRAEFTGFAARTEGHKIRDEQGSHLVDLAVTFDVTFPDGPEGDAARAVVPRTLRQIQERLCTVGRTVALGEPVAYREGPLSRP